jgi:hypothetical protein
MIVIVAVRPHVILGRQYFLSADRTIFFIFWENMTYSSKKCPFSIAFKLRFKEIFTEGKKQVGQFLIETTADERFAPIGGW